MKRLTTAEIEALGPRAIAYDVTDPGVPGLQLRVMPSGAKTWQWRFYWQGRRQRLSLGEWDIVSLARARELVREANVTLSQGIDPRRARSTNTQRAIPAKAMDPHSIEFLAHEFIERHIRPNRKNPEAVERVLAKDILAVWHGRDARSIKPREVIELLDGIVERGSRVMANRVAGLLGQLFKFGIHRAIVEDTPVKLLMRPGGKERPKSRALTDDELRIFLADPTAGTRFPRLGEVMILLLLTAQRRGELTLARWREIDLDAKTWRIPDENAKTRGHVVPLSDWAVRELRTLKRRAGRSPWVLPAKDGSGPIDAKLLTRNLARCQSRFKRLGIARFTLHDLRRTCRTGLARLRVPPHIAERVLNHAQERIPGTYDVHDYLDEKRAALDQWATHLESLAASSPAAVLTSQAKPKRTKSQTPAHHPPARPAA